MSPAIQALYQDNRHGMVPYARLKKALLWVDILANNPKYDAAEKSDGKPQAIFAACGMPYMKKI